MDKIIFYSVLLEDEILKSFNDFQEAYDFYCQNKKSLYAKNLFLVEHNLILKYTYDKENSNE